MQDNPYHTYVAYRDNDSWTSERGAGKFMDLLLQRSSLGVGDNGCVINGMKVIQNPTGADMTVTIQANDGTTKIKNDGHCIIQYSDYIYEGWQESDYRLMIEGAGRYAHRRSYIVAYIDRDVEFERDDHIIESPSVLKFAEVKGAESQQPVPPTRTMINETIGVNNPYIILAEILINANQSSITSSYITDRRVHPLLNSDIQLDPANSWATGFYQPSPNNGVKTRIVVTGPNAATPAAIPGVQLIWLRKKL